MKGSLVFLSILLFALTDITYAVSEFTESNHPNNSSMKLLSIKNDRATYHRTSFSSFSLQSSRVEIFTIEMPEFENRLRNIQVYLPPDYDSSEKAYPVFYLHDGEYAFNPPPAANGDYAIDETLDQLFYDGLIEGVIAVGIEHDRDNPWDEYSPWINENMHDWVNPKNHSAVVGGDGFAYLDFIVNTLKPEIDSRYRTLADRENTAIGGFCRGGLIPILAGLNYPDVFSMVMSMSPSVWLAEGGGAWLSNNQLINHINSITIPENVKFYLDVGTEETSGSRPPIKDQDGKRITYPQAYLEGTEVVYSTLLANGLPEQNVYFEIFEGVAGGRDEWAKRFDEAVLWLMKERAIQVPSPTPTYTLTPKSSSNETSTPMTSLTPTDTLSPKPKLTLMETPSPRPSITPMKTFIRLRGNSPTATNTPLSSKFSPTPTISTDLPITTASPTLYSEFSSQTSSSLPSSSPNAKEDITENLKTPSEPPIAKNQVHTLITPSNKTEVLPEKNIGLSFIIGIIIVCTLLVFFVGLTLWNSKKTQSENDLL